LSELTQLVGCTIKARRLHKWRSCADTWKFYQEAPSAKGAKLGKAKAKHFKQAVADTARVRKCI
jgi:hypothetical protein